VKVTTPAAAFTRAELKLINSMCAIASSSQWGEGDYCAREWKTAAGAKTFSSLRRKVFALMRQEDDAK
jgi:hypothetical protein